MISFVLIGQAKPYVDSAQTTVSATTGDRTRTTCSTKRRRTHRRTRQNSNEQPRFAQCSLTNHSHPRQGHSTITTSTIKATTVGSAGTVDHGVVPFLLLSEHSRLLSSSFALHPPRFSITTTKPQLKLWLGPPTCAYCPSAPTFFFLQVCASR